MKRENAANQDDEVRTPQKVLPDSGASSMNDSLSIYMYVLYICTFKAALADLEKKINNAGANWAGIESRFESANHWHFFIDLLENGRHRKNSRAMVDHIFRQVSHGMARRNC